MESKTFYVDTLQYIFNQYAPGKKIIVRNFSQVFSDRLEMAVLIDALITQRSLVIEPEREKKLEAQSTKGRSSSAKWEITLYANRLLKGFVRTPSYEKWECEAARPYVERFPDKPEFKAPSGKESLVDRLKTMKVKEGSELVNVYDDLVKELEGHTLPIVPCSASLPVNFYWGVIDAAKAKPRIRKGIGVCV